MSVSNLTKVRKQQFPNKYIDCHDDSFLFKVVLQFLVTLFEKMSTMNKPVKMELLRCSLHPLNWDLSLCGCPIFNYKWKPVNYFLGLHAIILIINILIPLFDKTSDVGVKNNTHPIVGIMMMVWNLLAFSFYVAFILIVWWIRKRLNVLLNELSKYLTRADHRQILVFTTKVFIFKVIFTLLFEGFYIYSSFDDALQDKDGKVTLQHVMVVYYQVTDPIVGTAFLYLALLKVVHLAEGNLITGLNKDILSQSPRVVHYTIKKCIQFKDTVSKQVSILVCMMFGYLFVYAVCSFCRFQIVYFDNSASTPVKMWALVSLTRFVIYFILAMFLVFMTHKLSQESQEKLSVFEDTIVHLDDTQKWTFVLNEIKVAQEYAYRAFDFFKIDRNLLLSFLSSFVSLTTLFIQVINGLIKPQSECCKS